MSYPVLTWNETFMKAFRIEEKAGKKEQHLLFLLKPRNGGRIMALRKLQNILYKSDRFFGDVRAVRNGTIGKRIGRRMANRMVQRLLNRVFK